MKVEEKGLKQTNENRKVRSDKRVHVNPALDQDTHYKLQRLAFACQSKKTQLAEEIIKMAVNHPDIINWLQDCHKVSEFRIIPITTEHGIEY